MVRLKEQRVGYNRSPHLHFNSSMVRLKDRKDGGYWGKQRISIPVWCDWKSTLLFSVNNLLNISIPVWCDWKIHFSNYQLKLMFYFNSSMVRLKGPWNRFRFWFGFISIPVWCDWKLLLSVVSCAEACNFNSSMVRLKGRRVAGTRRGCFISIPVWCDWKRVSRFLKKHYQKFQFQYGAIESF